jgi:RNA polymerase sigma factor (TIGR02999 family)
MLADSPQDLTQILNAIGTGEERPADAILPLVYDELRAIAVGHLRQERFGHTLQATALVHETYVRLVDQNRVHWKGRAHFLAISATMMRRILVNHAKARQCEKRGGGAARMELTIDTPLLPEKSLDLLALDEAMCRLAELDPQQCRIVELRFFGGLTANETAQVVGISERTVHREWTFAKAWLRGEISKGDEHDD